MYEENNIVKCAIIMAAGSGKRMQPLTFETPKPLIKVNGVRMIDTLVDALLVNEIREIYVVVGYLKEQFYDWAAERGDVKIIENPYYNTCNNISSLYVAREHLEGCIILDGDQIIYNPTILDSHFSISGYNAVWCDDETKEWLMEVKDGVVRRCSRTGGTHGWKLYSISRWSRLDGKKLRKHIEYEFERGNRQVYWDDVPMFYHFNDYVLGIREMKSSDIIEIDSIDELAAIDYSYRYYLQEQEEAEGK